MLKRLVIFLVRKKLRLKKYQEFRFENQKSPVDYYFFTKNALIKYDSKEGEFRFAGVSLNWLLHDRCEIRTFTTSRRGTLIYEKNND